MLAAGAAYASFYLALAGLISALAGGRNQRASGIPARSFLFAQFRARGSVRIRAAHPSLAMHTMHATSIPLAINSTMQRAFILCLIY